MNAHVNANVFEHPTFTKRKQCRRLVAVLEMTKEMVSLADKGLWTEVGEIEVQRRDQLNECFAYEIEDDDSYLMAEALATVLHLNEELMSMVAGARRKLIDQQSESHQNANSIFDYLDVSGLS